MKIDLLDAGRIIGTHGIRGELRIIPWADSPAFLTGFESFYIDDKPVRVLFAKVHKSYAIVSLDGISDIDAAIKMKGKLVKINKNEANLDEGLFFIADLIGLSAINADTGEKIGIVNEVLTLPAHNVYVIKGDREILIPAVSEFVVETNLEEGFVKLRLIEGL